MAVANLVVAVRTTGAASLAAVGAGMRTLTSQVRSTSAAGSAQSAQLARDYQRAAQSVQTLSRAVGQARADQASLRQAAADANAEYERMRRLVAFMGQGASAQLRQRMVDAGIAAAQANTHLSHMNQNVHNLTLGLMQANTHAIGLRNALTASTGNQSSFFGRLSAQVRQLPTLLSSAMSSFNALPLQKQIMAAVIGIGVAVAPAIGAAIGGLITAALGAAVLGGGVALAVSASKNIQKAFTDVFGTIGRQAQDMAVNAFEIPLIRAATAFGAAWGSIRGDVSSMFLDLAHAVEPLADGIAGLVSGAMPGFREAVANAVPLLRELGTNLLPAIGKGLGEFFAVVSRGSGNLEGLRFLVAGLVGVLLELGYVIKFLSDGFDSFARNGEVIARFIDDATGRLIPVNGLILQSFEKMNAGAAGFARTLPSAIDAADRMNDPLIGLGQSARQVADEFHKLTDAIFGMVNKQLNLDEALTAWNAGLLKLRTELHAGKDATDQHTAAGVKNAQAVQGMAEKALSAHAAAIELAGGQNASKTAVAAANATYSAQIGVLEGVLRKMGFTEAQIRDLIGQYKAIPSSVTTTVTARFVVSGQYATYRDAVNSVGAGNVIRTKSGQIGFASGTKSAPKGWAWTGEDGPELVNFGGGEQVLDAKTSARAVAGSGGGITGGSAATLQVMPGAGGSGLERLFVDWLHSMVRSGQIRLRSGGVPVTV